MRQAPHPKRGRGRGGNRRPGGGHNRNQTFDSNGPDVRIRGNAHQVHEKYLTLARDASASGDRVLAESYFQHAEHYFRILNAFADEADARERRANGAGNGRFHDGEQPQPDLGGRANFFGAADAPAPAPVAAPAPGEPAGGAAEQPDAAPFAADPAPVPDRRAPAPAPARRSFAPIPDPGAAEPAARPALTLRRGGNGALRAREAAPDAGPPNGDAPDAAQRADAPPRRPVRRPRAPRQPQAEDTRDPAGPAEE